MLAITIVGPTWMFWQGLPMDALQLVGADLLGASTPGSGAISLTTLLYLVFCVTVLVFVATHDGAFRSAMLVHMTLLPPLIGLMLVAGGVPRVRSALIDGAVAAAALMLTYGIYLWVSCRVHVIFELRDRIPGEHAWFRRQRRAAAG